MLHSHCVCLGLHLGRYFTYCVIATVTKEACVRAGLFHHAVSRGIAQPSKHHANLAWSSMNSQL